MGRRTPLYALHLAAGARVVDFAGWDMPLHYGSQLEEHHAVRRAAGIFDVSHMAVLDLEGAAVIPLLRRLLANDVARSKGPGGALYSCMLNPAGGVIDDLIVYTQGPERARLVVNAGTRDQDLAWIRGHAAADGVRVSERTDLAILAVQGPRARAAVHDVVGPDLAARAQALPRFAAVEHAGLFVARTGYTGEDGYELILPGERAGGIWSALLARGVLPAGLGARDTLRLEAGLALYGADMDASTTPLESNLGWTVAWEPRTRDFIGRTALERQRRDGPNRVLVGLILEDRGILRARQPLRNAAGEAGEVTSGGFAPTLGRSIGLARVPAGSGPALEVEVRGRRLAARMLRPPFVRAGRARLEELAIAGA